MNSARARTAGDLARARPEFECAAAKPARWSRRVAVDIVAIIDIAVVVVAAYASMALHQLVLGPVDTEALPALQLALITGGATQLVLNQLGAYEHASMARFPCNPARILLAAAIAFAIVLAIVFTLHAADDAPRTWFPLWLGLAASALFVERLAIRRVLRFWTRSGYFDTNVAVYGMGRIAAKLATHVGETVGIRLVGIYDDRQDPTRVDFHGLTPAGRLADLIEAGRRGDIDEIVIALPPAADQRIGEIARRLEQLPVRLRVCTHIASDILDVEDSRHRVSSLGPLGLLDLKSKPLADWGPLVKHVEDYTIAGLALALIWPVMLVVALAIKLDGPGPVLFRQKRHGLNHRVIEVMKFRTMRADGNGAEVRQATRNDPRITRVGAFLRRSSLDELPQFFNILKGEMALVGPRPHALVHNEKYGEMLERYANRHQVKPGITGWAQINGFRGETLTAAAMQSRVEHDLHYIDNWSLWLDLRIIAMTPIYGLVGKNAY